MKYLKTYKIFESVLVTDDKFKSILKLINSPISNFILNLIDKDIKTNYNALRLTDKSDQIEFLSDNQYLKINNIEEAFKKKGNSTSIGRLVRSLLSDNKFDFKDSDIESFVNSFKSSYDLSKGVSDRIRIVEGDDIIKWYNQNIYSNPGKPSPLSQSCMRYSNCSKFFDIYTKNSDVCKLIIYVDDNNKLLSRALFWKLDTSSKNYEYYVDRVYYTNDSESKLVNDWVKSMYPNNSIGSYNGVVGRINVKLKESTFDYYPYLDSLFVLNRDTNILSNNTDDTSVEITLQTTDGTYQNSGTWCEFEDEYYPEDEVIYSNYHECYIHEDNARYSEYYDEYYWHDLRELHWSKYHDDYIIESNGSYSKNLNDWLIEEKAYLVYLNSDKSESDYYPEDQLNDEYYENANTGEYYITELMTEFDGDWYLTSGLMTVYKVDYEIDYKLTTGSVNLDPPFIIEFMTKEDMVIFGIKEELGETKTIKTTYDEQLFGNMIIALMINIIDFKSNKEFYNRLSLYYKYSKTKDKLFYSKNYLYLKYKSFEQAISKIIKQSNIVATKSTKELSYDEIKYIFTYVCYERGDINGIPYNKPESIDNVLVYIHRLDENSSLISEIRMICRLGLLK